ncbi:hypothetical protein JD844_022552 [Phrynosoma platyrhinos]|uniref:DNA helicase n=1 Tax=Phrynosoma platyrhinos TaxID=52577 RepID=A0ABQ7SVT8_PHRPL|nr:hypothetical protein JD844_022552 [Phrynosoma platyrhinos]
MAVAGAGAGAAGEAGALKQVRDEVAEKCQKLFQDFLEEFQNSDGEVKYLRDAEELIRPERNTLIVSFEDLEQFNQQLATTIQEEFYRDHGNVPPNKDFYVAFQDLSTRHKIREMTSARIGSLMRISGQVVRTHPVHPELVRIQETQAELPRGSIPRSVEVILRAEAVESAQAGDKCDFTGSLIVVPDVAQLSTPGVRAETSSRVSGKEGYETEGIRGLRALGVRELSYKLVFLACYVAPTNPRFGGKELRDEEQTAESIKNQMSVKEWEKVFEMSQDKNLYHNLCTSLFPTIHGNDEVKRGILLMLFGGVPKTTAEGTSLRGDINATLNARTSILAAANPVGGRYDRAKSLKQNINLSAPIMSRFDLFFILVDECNEVTDYAIARRIVDLHSRIKESIDRIYTLDDIRRYLLFARQFKPKISKESEDFIVEQYKRLRQRDGSGITKSSWRITVRQLESMIRLSEAMARMHCCDEVHPKHVKEAFRLLNKSIIRVETPDINLDQDEEEQPMEEPEAQDGDNGSGEPVAVNGLVNGTNGHADDLNKESTSKASLRLSFPEYRRISNLIVMHLRKSEEEDDEASLKKSELINWYLKEIESEIDSEEELINKKKIIEKVIHRLTHYDHILIELTQTGLKDSEEGQSFDEDPFLVVNPNYLLED